MHLKSLTLKGFKSFADRTHITLEPGVSVLVGPNGSGKSNVSDAVLWVLGEQSAKALRGNAMEDVIFAGSSARSAVGVAEVDIVLDNSDGTVPLEFTEVTITRRMYRSGESEYLINQTPSRLMDVHDLLHDSGLGRDTHSIIGQGKLDELLNSRPEDRRSLIEEAAGVLKHKKRKERALRKLASMDAHVTRAKDVLREIDRQLRPLEKQAGRAVEHSRLVGEARDLDVRIAVANLRELEAEWDKAVLREKEHEAEIELSRYRLAERERDLAKFQTLLQEKGLFVGDLSEQRRRLQAVHEKLNSGLLLLEEKGKNLIERLSELRQKLHYSEKRLVERRAELERFAGDRGDSDAKLKGLYQRLSELRRESEAAKKQRLAADEDLTRTSAEARKVRKDLDDARMELSKLDHALSAFALEEQLLSEQEAVLRSRRSSLQATLAARRTRLDQVAKEHERVRKELRLAQGDVDKRVRVLDARRRDLADAREALAATRAEIRGIEEIDRAFASASPAVAWALTKEREIPGLVAPLTEGLTPQPEYEYLLETVLGMDLFGIVVRDGASAVKAARMLRELDAGDVTLMPLDRMRGAPEVAGDRLLDHVACEDPVRPALEALLGDVVVVPDLETAMDGPSGARRVTLAGETVFADGRVSLGRAADSGAGVLSRKRRANELADETASLEARVGEAEAETAEAEAALNAAQQDALELGQRVAAAAGDLEAAREEVGRLEEGLTELDSEAAGIENRVAGLAERTEKDRPARAEAASRIEQCSARVDELEELAVVQRDAREGLYREESAIGDRLSACQVDIAAVSEREVHLKRQTAAIQADIDELQATLDSASLTEQGLEALRERIQPVHDLYTVLIARAEHWNERLRDRARFEQADSESLRDTIGQAQDAVRAAQAEIDEKNSLMSDVRVEKGRVEVLVRGAASRIVEDLGVPLERALESQPLEDVEAAQDRLHAIRKSLENIGPVNAVAVQEFEAVKERRASLASQMDDLVAGRAALHKVVKAIDRKVRDRFLSTFEEVDAHFQDVFAVLFPGGRASLSLTDPDDPETTGVEVVAQPAGKRLQKMSLLSGGEKALTALALLFAVYLARPCPFYILDEVDAALDDANLTRFVAFVDGMRDRAQFVVVTHQRRTMEAADVLYGVSMQADGVTKVVSQRLDRTALGPADE